MRISDWSSDVCSSDLRMVVLHFRAGSKSDDFGATPLLACPAERFVDGNPGQPGRQLCVAAKAGHGLIGVDISVLHHVLGFAIVVEDAARCPVDRKSTRLNSSH